LSWIETAKRAAVNRALQEIQDARVISIGSGSTLELLVLELAKTSESKIPTSHQIEAAMTKAGLSFVSPNQVSEIDLALDGADQVASRTLDLIKGGGAAMLREKVVAAAAKRFVVVVDKRKLSSKLGIGQAVPVEVLPFASGLVMKKLESLDGKPTLRYGKMKAGPVVTDNGNFVIDVDFGSIEDPSRLESQLKSIPGLVETGLFLNMTDRVFVGREDGTVQVLEPA
jgi:ribose 5-phosphate isomerase A